MSATDGIALVDQHCHGVLTRDVDSEEFGTGLAEAQSAGNRDRFQSLLGLAVRRWCAPVLDLPPHSPPEDYLARRSALGWREVTERLLAAAGVEHWLLDTGYAVDTSPAELAELGGGTGHEVLRVEQVAERLAARADSPAALLDRFRAELHERAQDAVALKSVLAYRSGLDLPGDQPTDDQARHAAGDWLRAGGEQLTDPVLHAWVVHEAARVSAEQRLPLQFHTGFGDADLHLHQVDPLRLTHFLRSTQDTGATVVLLHCWPYHRHAAYLAHVYDHVYVDTGLMIPFVGTRAGGVLAETLEVAPFESLLYSSDGNVLPELHHLAAALWRHHLGRLLDTWLADDVLDTNTAERLAHAAGAGNATRLHPRLASRTKH
ncbi:amidohydrolase family protein [Actinophytocola algeriensis]|uniref:Amidohydrolase-related domain-containing protein n=1 Tax=Actinophytocola algeriensis TaxID=1768010 RepID=A0A7W7Q3U8_9PSEU|nr:amidohydrolase family protein [Actinophytocola algeriensis]MBB4906214.1 hypothetical protein [Actinophytocola algeriensis]MBE1472101.1 putative TIM-barrel fold metal-dependent hydrolase [Actinophytocola algeriensis]